MKIELKNIKYAEFASEETHCFEGKLYVNGKHVADLSNDGHGGADYVYWKDGAAVTEKQVNEWIKANVAPSVIEFGDREPMTIEPNLEIFCGNAVNDFLTERQVNKAMRDMAKKVLTFDGKDVSNFRWKGLKKVEQRHIDSIKKSYPDRIILNCLASSEARTIIRNAISG